MNPWVRIFAVASLPLALAACGTTGGSGSSADSEGTLPAAIAVPSGNTLAMTLKGSGLQNYECKPTSGGGYDWELIGPEAVLRDKGDVIVGRHYPGPTWEYGDDSKISGKLIADAPAPTPGSIPWLLLKATPIPHPGALAAVTYVQRIHTIGGVAPSDTCGFPNSGTRKGVRYTADYLFYKP